MSIFHKNRTKLCLKKNDVFEKVVLTAIEDSEFYHRSRRLSAQLLFNKDNLIVFRIANKRKFILEKEFVESIETNEPSTLVLIYNDGDVQRMAIEQHRDAFPDTDIVAKVIQNAASRLLQSDQLNVVIRKEYCETEFWNFVRENPNQIQMIRFEFEYPNLPRLREHIGDVIKAAGKSISGDKATIQYEATNNGLNLEEGNQVLQQLNRASSEGGNPIIFRLRGQRVHYKTGETTVTKEIDELEITADNVIDIQNILRTVNNNE